MKECRCLWPWDVLVGSLRAIHPSFALLIRALLLVFATTGGELPAEMPSDVYLTLDQAERVRVGWGEPRSNASLSGKELSIGTKSFDQGMTLHAPAELVHRLKKKYRWLSFSAGINSEMTEKGSVTVQVWLDGKRVFETPVMRVKAEPFYVHLAIAGADELKLVVTDAGDGIAADHLSIANLRVTDAEREPKPERSAAEVFVGESPPPQAAPLSLWYRRPARRWLDALPLGNGRVGAMVFGGVDRERLALNEVSLWAGEPSDQHESPAAREAFAKFRELFWSGRPDEADALVPELLGRELNYGTNLPGGDLLIRHSGIRGEIRDYRRELDLDLAVARVTFECNGVRYNREVLASHPHGVLALRLTADRPGMLGFSLRYDAGRLPCRQRLESDHTLVVDGRAFGPHSDGKCGVAFRALFRVLPEGGTIRADGDCLTVDNADAATVLVVFNTDFQRRNPSALCAGQIAAAQEKGWNRLRADHVADHQRLFRRVSLDLGGDTAAGQPTDARLESVRQGQADPHLAALFFHYGRYLVIAGSRDDSPLPMHLQGIWNDNLACNMGWTCDFHLDINTQQNYWPTEICNLSECGEPWFRLLESLPDPGRRTARTTYGVDQGWVCHVFTNAWGFTAPGWGRGWGLHVTGGVWGATHLWEHYRFTGDREFLAQRAYPVLKGAAEFFLAYLARDPASGLLYPGPSVSPERGGEVLLGPTHDRAMVYELFTACIEASRVLGVDEGFRGRLEAARAKLPPYRIGRNGQLHEWEQDDGGQTNHRHTSHLVALFPLAHITPRTTPELAQAASKSLELRMGRPDWEDVEWSRANAIAYHARLLDGDKAEASVKELIAKLAGNNLLTISVAGIAGAASDIFCIDGNCAGTAAMAEMLLQSHDRTQDGDPILDLLPALPKAWPAGKVVGLRARGGFEVDMEWKGGRLNQATVRRIAGSGRATLRCGDKKHAVDLPPGGTTRWEPVSVPARH